MEIHVIRCGEAAAKAMNKTLPLPVHEVPEIPGRKDLAFIDDLAARLLPHDPTPSLDEIAAQPDVAHLGAPGPDPRTPISDARLVVVGTDAALDAVATRLMRIDATWIQLAYVPVVDSPVATSWGVIQEPWRIALSGPVRPIPLLRDDSGLATLGIAEICTADGSPFDGEIIVDATTMTAPVGLEFYGVRLAAMLDAPGIAAVTMTGPSVHAESQGANGGGTRGLLFRFRRNHNPGETAANTMRTGRAVQAGGKGFMVYRDGIAHPRPVDRVTFYRHLRDLQAVRG